MLRWIDVAQVDRRSEVDRRTEVDRLRSGG